MASRTFREALWSGRRDATLPFRHMRTYLHSLGFTEQIRGSHHIFTHPELEEIINLQPKRSRCKPYQVKQVRRILARHGRK